MPPPPPKIGYDPIIFTVSMHYFVNSAPAKSEEIMFCLSGLKNDSAPSPRKNSGSALAHNWISTLQSLKLRVEFTLLSVCFIVAVSVIYKNCIWD